MDNQIICFLTANDPSETGRLCFLTTRYDGYICQNVYYYYYWNSASLFVNDWCVFISRSVLPGPVWVEAPAWISLISTRASVRMVTRGEPVRSMWTSAERLLLTSPRVSMEPPASTGRDQTSHAGAIRSIWFWCIVTDILWLNDMNHNS